MTSGEKTAAPSHTNACARFGWRLVALGFGGFLLWAALAPLDSGVVVEGKVTVAGYRKIVQHPSGGVVNGIFVTDGDRVRQGQLLMRIDAAIASAQAAAAGSGYAMALAAEQRLLAEREARPTLEFAPELHRGAGADTPIAAALELQRRLLDSRRRALQAELDNMRESQVGTESRLAGLQALLDSHQQRRHWLLSRLEGLESLEAQGFGSRHQVLELRDGLAEVEGDLASTRVELEAARSALRELDLSIQQRRADYQRQLDTELVETRQRVAAEAERLASARFALSHTDIRAPVSGTVMAMRVFTEGAVIAPGGELLDILPDNQPLRVDAQVPVDLIDSVTLAQPVELLFTAFNTHRTPRLPGQVTMVAADSLADPATQRRYYAVHISVAPELLRSHGLTIQPGMPVQAFLRAGERSLLNYLFKPLADRIPGALAAD